MGSEKHNDFLNKLIHQREDLPKKQKQLCEYMIENYQSIGVQTIAELSKSANVGTTTVMRLIKNLGYKKYSDIKKDIYSTTVQNSPSTWWHLQESFKHTEEVNHTLSNTLAETEKLLNQTITPLFEADYELAVKLLLKAEKINILGLRSSRGIAVYFGHLLEQFFPKVNQLSNETDFIYNRILKFTEDDILIIIANAPLSTMAVEVAKFCYEQKKVVIFITDHYHRDFTVAPYTSLMLKTKASTKQYSVLPTFLLLESLIIEIGRKTSDRSITRLQEISDVLQKKYITQ